MAEQRMVLVKNMMNSGCGISDPSTGFKRRWQKQGQTIPIPFDQLQQLLWQDGVRRMIDHGMLYIENMKDKQDLGLEPLEATKPTNIIALNATQMRELLTVKPIDVFKKELSQLPDVQIDNLIDFAISNKIVDSQKCAILKQITGRDILQGISRKQDMELEEKAQRQSRMEGRRV